MNVPEDSLLARLNAGDEAALQEMFVSIEPFMRMVIRRRISSGFRAKFDSADVVQSVWANFVGNRERRDCKFENLEQFRAYMVRMACNRLIDHFRKHRMSVLHKATTKDDRRELPADHDPSVSEDFYAAELWEQLRENCPPAHYDLLVLKRYGASVAEIAQQTNLHEGSVRRVLAELARRILKLRKSPSI
jgi:RNA polymerase sigma factor (sigma-70 family)